MAAMSKAEFRRTLVRLGISTADGRLTQQYAQRLRPPR
jgi:hypothetical protein